jgi:hypothetical protein
MAVEVGELGMTLLDWVVRAVEVLALIIIMLLLLVLPIQEEVAGEMADKLKVVMAVAV